MRSGWVPRATRPAHRLRRRARRRRAARPRTRAPRRACPRRPARGRGRRATAVPPRRAAPAVAARGRAGGRRCRAAPAPGERDRRAGVGGGRAVGGLTWSLCPSRTHRADTPQTLARRYGPACPAARLITIEGLDGAGKTTLAEALARELRRARGRASGRAPARARRACTSRSASASSCRTPRSTVSPQAEALLYAAARAQLVRERLRPRSSGRAGSARPLRGLLAGLPGRGARTGRGADPHDQPLRHRSACTRPHAAAAHLPSSRARTPGHTRARPDRLECEGEAFFARIAGAYEDARAAEPRRIVSLDAERPPEAVLRDALAAIEDLL